ncbi:CerR family C-terminal domain-containing protein [Glaciecola petra]|uniref:CerR family C-terminal domain-containing protein n=1 Tax=Glaciecola petra TaxID=3075602 RepID=A0ABU2ZUP2_9ALTE|nr:CerR family C-terminal domain-containing protein [Aestuariibacter sp. P117]MDT0596305.1 CerR family C-terminal domain-containing protein [Aestuariibacter sp. P117]
MIIKLDPENISSRDQIILIALDLFGQRGYSNVSIRQVCTQAKVNVAAVNYHFGSKDKLYIAVADYVSSQLMQHLNADIEAANAVLEDTNNQGAQALEVLLHIVENTVDLLVPDSEESERWARFITRFQLGEAVPDHALLKNPMLHIIAQLIGVIKNNNTDTLENAILAQTIMGQVLIFRVSRVSAMINLNIDGFGQAETEKIKHVIRQNIITILTLG